jgi:hypothetical protein
MGALKTEGNNNSRTETGAPAPKSTPASFLRGGIALVFDHIHGLSALVVAPLFQL